MAIETEAGRGPGAAPTRRAGRRGVWGWMLFDWATQPFSTLVLTFVFAPYFADRALSNESAQAFLATIGLGFMIDPAAADDAAGGQALWGLVVGVVGILIALTAPVLGALADATGPRKPWIAVFSVLAIVGSWGLWFLPPDAGTGAIWIAIVAFSLAFIGFEFAAVFNNAMMPDLVPRAELGRLSGNAWALGYLGGLVALVVMLVLFVEDAETGVTLAGMAPALGLDAGAAEGTRATGPLTAIWYALFVLPLFLFTPDAPRRARVKGAIAKGLSELRQTLRTLPRQRSLFAYLGSSMLYRDGLNGLYTFGGIYAKGVLGWPITLVGVFGILTLIIGALGAWLGGKLDALAGPKTVVVASILALIAVTLTVVSLDEGQAFFLPVGGVIPAVTVTAPLLGELGTPDLIFLGCGMVIGAAGGALQASSRTLLVDQADPTRMTEAFGLYALSGKATSFIAPLLVSGFTAVFASQRAGVAPLVALFVAGLVLLPLVRGRRG